MSPFYLLYTTKKSRIARIQLLSDLSTYKEWIAKEFGRGC